VKISEKLRSFLLWVILAAGLVWAWQEGKMDPVIKTGREIVFGKPPQKPTVKDFKFQPVTRQDIHQKVLATGTVTLKTGAEVKIGARISGQVKNLLVKIGDFIRAGEIIAIIEHEDLLSRVARFKADLDAEKARQLKILAEGPLEINKAVAEREELLVQIKLAQKMLERNQELNQKGFVSTTILDEAEEKLEVLKARINLANEELKLKQSQSAVILQLALLEFQFLIRQIDPGLQHFQFFFRLIQNGGGDKTFLVQFLIALQHFLRQLDLNQQFLALRHGLVNFQRTLGEYF
jgi:HlyD family secretion protein/macrolide-specific efflux system membrane fusion protein